MTSRLLTLSSSCEVSLSPRHVRSLGAPGRWAPGSYVQRQAPNPAASIGSAASTHPCRGQKASELLEPKVQMPPTDGELRTP